MIEAISGIFLESNRVLLLQRAAQRTWNPNKWDLMGGDVREGEDFEEVFLRDAKQKLGINTVSIKTRGILELIGETDIVRRNYFVCRGDYTKITLDPTKYSQFGWFNPRRIHTVELVPGVREVFTHIKFFKMI